ncbi:NAD(P)-dependent oxidoreductase [Gammaproteobacteria bacterium]|nr:NAD(P)-dependent oxidoreductase [Gammaproteobacteria bacterium]
MEIAEPIKLLVVGGSGFIGKAIVMHGVSMNMKVDSLGLSIPSEDQQVSDVNYLNADITDSKSLQVISKQKYHYVVNTGGYIDHANFMNGGDKIIGAHFNGVVNLVKSIDRSNLLGFINIGSSDEYSNTVAPHHEGIRENPISPYSAGKVASTHFLQMLHKTEQFPSTTLRLFLCYGPGQDVQRFLPYLISQCVTNEEIKVSPGEQLRDYCYIDDIVAAVFLAMSDKYANGKVYNIASGQPISIRSVVEKVVGIIGSGKPNFGAMPYRQGESMELYADITLVKNELGWEPTTQLDAGLEQTISYYRNL